MTKEKPDVIKFALPPRPKPSLLELPFLFMTPKFAFRTGVVIGVLVILCFFYNSSASEFTGGMNRAGAGQGMFVGLVVLLCVPLAMGWMCKRKVKALHKKYGRRGAINKKV
ncbi:hypothetical protein [Carnimonas bestiolae]|uniref:hypothetical protein n=1 Tax=Carnimonas bestiolae TaxID=3402172 RepID=UPI003EDBA1F5